MITSKTHTPPKPVFSSWMDWIKGSGAGHRTNTPINLVHSEEFSDHMMRDIGLLDGRNSRGYRRRHSIDGRLDDKFNGPL